MFGLEWGTIKLIAIGIAVAAVLGYIGFLKLEISHYETKANDIQTAFDAFKITNKAMHDAFQSENAALTLKIKEQGIEELKLIAQNQKDNDAKIRALNLNHVLSAQLVELLNSGTQVHTGPEGPASTEPGHASGTNTPAATDTPFTEEDWALTDEENKANHKACIVIVHKWQNLWKGLVSNTPSGG